MNITLAIAGCAGRMGQAVIAAARTADGVTLAAGGARPGFDEAALRKHLAACGGEGLRLTSDPGELAGAAEAVIDFTAPESSLALARAVAGRGGVHVIGTTGFTEAEIQELAVQARRARIVRSGNFSPGVSLLEKLVEQAARLLDESYDIEIFEMHHRHKKDAPSGTALMLGQAAARGRGAALADKKLPPHDGVTGGRGRGGIGFSAARGGDVVGIHKVMLAGSGEMIELSHQGFSREIYARGAIRAVLWAEGQPPGLYSMRDVLG